MDLIELPFLFAERIGPSQLETLADELETALDAVALTQAAVSG
jgi:hypothetical protein